MSTTVLILHALNSNLSVALPCYSFSHPLLMGCQHITFVPNMYLRVILAITISFTDQYAGLLTVTSGESAEGDSGEVPIRALLAAGIGAEVSRCKPSAFLKLLSIVDCMDWYLP